MLSTACHHVHHVRMLVHATKEGHIVLPTLSELDAAIGICCQSTKPIYGGRSGKTSPSIKKTRGLKTQ